MVGSAMIRLRTLASGSSGNSTFLRVGEARILIDAGISYGRIQEGLRSMGESVESLSALVLTHAHGDHICGLEELARRHRDLPIMATEETAQACGGAKEWGAQSRMLRAGEAVMVEGLKILPFATEHDAPGSLGFRFEGAGFALGFATDLGRYTPQIVEALRGCQVLLVESNYDEELLQWSPYPAFLKRQIAGPGGHLSNRQCASLLKEIAGPELERVLLLHLSEKNNRPALALLAAEEALKHHKKVHVQVAPRHKPGLPLSFRAGPQEDLEDLQICLPF